ncbi:hypothetical protein [Natronoglomus mannanivorans]|uniref:Nucleotide modification associated domain-containing protein n=1 Tax=Natronoglomus mannanivorans TaxID=2979990 RepID=A0AAP3E1X7_9EURY|nr:hypothetical protein [Halobacteria archaeon AArc-xg1-1]
MTAVLAGIGADSTNVGALAPLYDDGRFEYVPIPEKTRDTRETATLGSWPLRHGEGVAADLTTRIRPRPGDDELGTVTGTALESWPLHRDPNFEALTYGEHRPGYVRALRSLEPGDAVGFYAGLRRPTGDRAHRYLIGYFTVEAVVELTPAMDVEERERVLETYSTNAHAKRAREGELYHAEKSVVIVDGRAPGGLFERDPVRLSDYYVKEGNQRAQYYLRESIAEAFSVVAGGANMMYKPAYECALSGAAFRDLVENTDRRTIGTDSEHGD